MAVVIEPFFFQELDNRLTNMRDRFCDRDPYRIQRCDLFYRSSFAAGNDGAGMAHALSWRRHAPSDEGSDRLLHMFMDPFCSLLFRRTTDFADHEDRLGIRVIIEKLKRIDEVRAFDRVTPDADRACLTDTCIGQLEPRRRGLFYKSVQG